MGYKAKNNAKSTLAAGITNVATSLSVATAQGDNFPAITAPDYTYLTLENAAGNREVIKVTARALGADTMTVVRAQDGTTARAWSAGDVVDLRLTAQVVTDAFTHISQTLAAHAASAISFTPVGGLSATDVQAALAELDSEKATAVALAAAIAGLGTMSAQNANAVTITGGTLTNTTVNTNVVGSNSTGTKTISTAAPSGGADGDVWYQY